MQIGNPKHREKLFKAVESCFKNLSACRRSRRMLIEDYAGDSYFGRSEFRANTTAYVNLIQLTAKAYTVGLSYNTPRFYVSTHEQQLKPFAERVKVGLNGLARKIRLDNAMRGCVLDAFFQLGISKTYLADLAAVDAEVDPFMDPGIPFVDRVSMDNWVHDIGADAWRMCGFMGDRYRMRLEDARSSDRFDPKAAKKLTTNEKAPWRTDSDLTSSISKEDASIDQGEFEDMVDLCEIYLPRERVLATFACDANFRIHEQQPLSVIDWYGAETGPYNFLQFSEVPDNLMPSSIAGGVRGLYVLFNNLLLKMSHRARNQKQVLAYQTGSEKDANRWKNAKDQSTVRMDDINSIATHELGGVDPGIQGYAMSIMELYKQQAGNLNLTAGLGPSAGTARQEEIISQNAGRQEALAKQATDRFATEIGTGLGELMFDDPMLVIPGSRKIEDTEFEIDASWMPPDLLPRQGTFRDYAINIELDSMKFKSHEERLQSLRGLVAEAAQFMPIMEQQGITFNFKKYLQKEAELANEPDFLDLFEFNGAPPMEGDAPHTGSQRMGGGGNKPHEYIRHNVSSGPQGDGKQQAILQQMAAAQQPQGAA